LCKRVISWTFVNFFLLNKHQLIPLRFQLLFLKLVRWHEVWVASRKRLMPDIQLNHLFNLISSWETLVKYLALADYLIPSEAKVYLVLNTQDQFTISWFSVVCILSASCWLTLTIVCWLLSDCLLTVDCILIWLYIRFIVDLGQFGSGLFFVCIYIMHKPNCLPSHKFIDILVIYPPTLADSFYPPCLRFIVVSRLYAIHSCR